ncbi:uracil-DNA glycosylase family protein [Candidatus Gracilibacteria bacterium]|nr:uracil-DNA glycosylase family protein [Candidatus Gracilibacteria bacterium]
MKDIFQKIYKEIYDDSENKEMKQKGYEPVYTAGAKAKIVIVGQAPGRKAQETKKPWNDVSGETLRKWLGITDEQFYDPDLISLMPMDFYYPGKGSHGDLPPRKGFAEKWHPILLENMPEVELFILIGAYSQKYYLAKSIKSNLTETVHSYEEYLPKYFPIVHPSPLNFRWRSKNPWFEDEVIPELQKLVQKIIEENKN